MITTAIQIFRLRFGRLVRLRHPRRRIRMFHPPAAGKLLEVVLNFHLYKLCGTGAKKKDAQVKEKLV